MQYNENIVTINKLHHIAKNYEFNYLQKNLYTLHTIEYNKIVS